MSDGSSLIGRLWRRLRGRGYSAAAGGGGDDLSRVSEFWAERAAETGDCPALPGVWTSHPVVRAAINRRISGRPEVEWLEWAKGRFFPEAVERAVSLGCGGGHVEREAIRVGLCRSIEGVDVSAGAIELARERAAAEGLSGISYRAADVNRIELARDSYDLVIAKQALHHIEALEHVLDEVRGSLHAGGWLLLNEYVGPSRFQWTEAQLELMNQVLALLPERLRRVGGPEGPVRERVERAPPEEIAAQDPSEAVRSGEIAGLVEERFEVVERRDLGGTLLNPMLEGIVSNFDAGKEEEAALLRVVVAAEEALLSQGLISSDFAVMVARRRD